MKNKKQKFPKHTCQYCGSESKLVETIIDDEFCWDEDVKEYLPNKFMDDFEHSGNERCSICEKK